jgi:hypothetical protein
LFKKIHSSLSPRAPVTLSSRRSKSSKRKEEGSFTNLRNAVMGNNRDKTKRRMEKRSNIDDEVKESLSVFYSRSVLPPLPAAEAERTFGVLTLKEKVDKKNSKKNGGKGDKRLVNNDGGGGGGGNGGCTSRVQLRPIA